jgi:hypothetical protein
LGIKLWASGWRIKLDKENLKIRNKNIVQDYKNGIDSISISSKYDLSKSSIDQILRGKVFRAKGKKKENLTGRMFSRWTVIGESKNRGNRPYWKCKCSCGNYKDVCATQLKLGFSKSCGCLSSELTVKRTTTHGQTLGGQKSQEYIMWTSAKRRSKVKNIIFDIKYTDIVIPEFCPVLGIKLECHKNIMQDNSPTLDRLIPRKGYTKENIRVISYKANSIKRDASAEELEKVYNWLKKEMNVNGK